MEIKLVYDDGSILTPEIFNISPDEILNKFRNGVKNIASISLATGLVNQTSVPHLIVNGFKNLAAAGLEAGIKFKQLENLTSGGGSSSAPAKVDAKAPAKDGKAPAKEPEKKKEEPKVEEDVGLGGDLFGDFWEWTMPESVQICIHIVMLDTSCLIDTNCYVSANFELKKYK